MIRTALVVDDSMLIRHTVCRFLEDRGYTVESATNGADALQILRGIRPDVLITDMMMPKMDGSQLITELKKDAEMSTIPIIVLAGRQSAAGLPPEHRANATIWKDIDIVTQLDKALRDTLGPES
ncbi:response regulator receiver protein [Candidatus Koribacter versatilis Ellin345]|uniref:Response regulator receiver protein n=1 Tax=Koribacter versatilis (strain Ellin345) TaxID=204669 RepID=Q1IUF7_KORVE|nr:response regulator [Candidatus Koribacter versatilis]ABF39493.1 response regulator receiver protein [Candidatus Koribacter versatilis Ellin345]